MDSGDHSILFRVW